MEIINIILQMLSGQPGADKITGMIIAALLAAVVRFLERRRMKRIFQKHKQTEAEKIAADVLRSTVLTMQQNGTISEQAAKAVLAISSESLTDKKQTNGEEEEEESR